MWPTLFLLGAYHGINPGMGWLFAVARGMQEHRTRAVAWSLPPIALGHALATGVVVLFAGLAERLAGLDRQWSAAAQHVFYLAVPPTVVELLAREGALLRVRGVDMLEGTPILDIKPYLSNVPPERLRRGWLAEAEARAAAKL